MSTVTNTSAGSGDLCNTEKSDEEAETELSEALSKIRSLYDAGTPFYTKEAIQDVDQQLEKSVEGGQKVWITGLNGIIVDFEVKTGRISPDFEPNLETVLSVPFISFRSLQSLTSPTRLSRYTYCSLGIGHRLLTRNKIAKELAYNPPTKSHAELEEFFKTAQKAWEASEPCKRLRSILMSSKTPCKISKIVAFAFGPMAYDALQGGALRAAFQHALLLTLRDVLGNKKANTGKIMCYAQDPAYNKIDESVLEEHGITVLGNPKGFLEVDDSTAVISCSPNAPVKQIISDLAQPSIMIWDRVSEDERELLCTDPDSPRLRKQIHDFYDSIEFPEDPRHFGDLVIYIRRTESREELCENSLPSNADMDTR